VGFIVLFQLIFCCLVRLLKDDGAVLKILPCASQRKVEDYHFILFLNVLCLWQCICYVVSASSLPCHQLAVLQTHEFCGLEKYMPEARNLNCNGRMLGLGKRTISKSMNLLISSCPCSVNLLDLGTPSRPNASMPPNAALMSARNARGVCASASQSGDGLQNTKREVKYRAPVRD
jgi:hypothetical protein